MTAPMSQPVQNAARAALLELCESGSPVVRPETVDKTLAVAVRTPAPPIRLPPPSQGPRQRLRDRVVGHIEGFRNFFGTS